MWIFGYGSIVWRPDFEWVERQPGYIEGWVRRFYQHSVDHRGVPGDPGRVATVVPRESEVCWGVAYRMDPEHRDEILEQLDHREKGGYERHEVDVYPPDGGEPIEGAIMYMATRENPHWAGPAEPESVAEQVVASEGPSGHNVEYVLELAEALREIGARDPHVFAIEREVRRRLEGR